MAYKRQDQPRGFQGFDRKLNDILQLKEAQFKCYAVCNIELLWAYQPKDTQQFSVGKLDNSRGHCRGTNVSEVQPKKRAWDSQRCRTP